MYTLTINVTQEHIDKGKCNHPGRCGIALAIRDIFPNAIILEEWTIFTPDEITDQQGMWFVPEIQLEVTKGNGIINPLEVQNFVKKFDNNKDVKPTSFDMYIPEGAINSINIEEIKQILKDHPNLVLTEQ